MLNVLLPYFRENRWKIAVGILCMLIVDGLQLVVPVIVKRAVDLLAEAAPDSDVFFRQAGIIALAGFFMFILRYWWRVLLIGGSRDLEKGIREQLFHRILTLDPAYYDTVKTGDIMAHATSDINHIRIAFGMGLVAMTDAVLLGGATVCIMLWMNVTLTLAALIPMPFLVIVIRHLGRKMHRYHETAQESYSALTELVRECFFGIRVIKVFNFEKVVSRKVADFSRDYFGKNLKRAFVTSLLRPCMSFFFNLSTFIIIIFGGYLVIRNTISPGELVAFIQYLGILSWPIIALGWVTNLLQRGAASLKRVNRLLSAEPRVSSPDGAVSFPPGNAPVRFEKVSFSYGDGAPVLRDISMTIAPESTIGISGPPGSGKTSFVQLVCRLYDPDSGRIHIGGVPIEQVELDSLRENIAYMPQESFLFSGTVRDNILMGKTVAGEKVDGILDMCRLRETVRAMPAGLDTMVGERGVTLSGGQKQRIALARTLLHEKGIIILDDPVSQMDTDTASDVLAGIHRIKARARATLIIVSHRISALTACDTVYIFRNGTIENAGSHDALMEKSRFYRESYAVQMFEGDHAR